MSLAVKHNGVFVTWLITKYDWSRKACLRTSSVMPPLPSLYYEYSPILLPPNRGASLLFIRSRRSRLESPRSMRNSALSTYSSVLSSKAQTSGLSCLNNSTICLSNAASLCGPGHLAGGHFNSNHTTTARGAVAAYFSTTPAHSEGTRRQWQ